MPKEILIYSPNIGTLTMIGQALQQTAYPALTAQSAPDAWDCIKNSAIGLIIMDLTAPSLDGLALLRAVRSAYTTELIPFLFLHHKDHDVPKLTSFAGERIHDGWLAVPCPSRQMITLVSRLAEQNPKSAETSGPRGLQPRKSESSSTLPETPAAKKAAAKSGSKSRVPKINAETIPAGAFGGKLGAIDVTKILGMLEQMQLTGMLVVDDGKRQGQIYFVNGTVWHAALAEIEGPDALFLLFHMKEGSFHFQDGVQVEERTIQGNTMALLLEGMRQMDEAKEMIQNFQEKRRQAKPST